jgi:hypothetical protein
MWRERVSYILRSSLAFVNIEGRRINVKNVEEAVFVITVDRRPRVKNVVESVFAITEGLKLDANFVEAVDFVFTTSKSTAVLNANGLKGKLISSV